MGEAMDARAAPQVDFDAHKIRALIARYLGIDAEQVTDEVHFRNDFDLDSLDQLELEHRGRHGMSAPGRFCCRGLLMAA